MEKVKCPYCGKKYSKKGIGTHIWRVHKEGKDFDPNRGYKDGSRKTWNKGLDKSDKRVQKYAAKMVGKEPWMKGKKHSEESRKKMSISAKEAFKKGIHATWKSRNIRSYPELYFEKILNGLDLTFIPEHPIKSKGKIYFLDFYFPEKNLNLEIDGQQHEFEERQISDKSRDEYLESIGIKVFRIKWPNINSEEGLNYISSKMDAFLKIYDRRV